eukprot:NODE_1232_length_2553_cov_3.267519.p1 GENE.NODE_1232_length_2553_cov_3.267519~~NODE_1232_length_2553_cov_3.267519.p1  ORF type:complete len:633 (-),score=207.59 NODE_1232_length_2553_cov_3.267519:189-2087(-)
MNQDALALYRDCDMPSGEALALHGLALAHCLNGATEMGLRAARQSLQIHQMIGDVMREGYALACMNHWYSEANRWAEAIDCGQQALDLFREHGPIYKKEAFSLKGLVHALVDSGDVQKGVDVAEEGLARFYELKDPQGQAEAMLAKFYAMRHLPDGEGALICAEDALEAVRALGNEVKEMNLLCSIAALHLENGDHTLAHEAIMEALPMAQEQSDASEEAGVYMVLINVYRAEGDLEAALKVAQDMQMVLELAGECRDVGIALTQVCQIQKDMEDFDEAIASAKEARRIFREAGDEKCEAVTIEMISEMHTLKGENYESVKLAMKARAFRRALADEKSEARVLLTAMGARLALLAECQEDNIAPPKGMTWEMAARSVNDALVISRKLGLHEFVGAGLCFAAQVQIAESMFDVALEYCEEALNIFQDSNNDADYATVLVIAGSAHFHKKEYDDALEYAEEALEVYQKIPDDEDGLKQAQNLIDSIKEKRPQSIVYVAADGSGEVAPGDIPAGTVKLGRARRAEAEEEGPKASGEGGGKAAVSTLGKFSPDMAITTDMFANKVMEIVKNTLGEAGDEVESDVPLMEAGITSSSAMVLRDALVADLPGFKIGATLVFDYPSVNDIAAYLETQLKK